VIAASVQDRNGAKTALLNMFHTVGNRFMLADGGFADALVDWCHRILATTLEIVRKPADPMLVPRRWPVEPTFAWLTAHRRLARDHERNTRIFEHLIRGAAINGRLGRPTGGGPAIRPARRTLDTLDSH
jgi:transposase